MDSEGEPMKAAVVFTDGTFEMTGYAGGVCPIDKAAELVLSSTMHPITSIVVNYTDGVPVLWEVAEVHIPHAV